MSVFDWQQQLCKYSVLNLHFNSRCFCIQINTRQSPAGNCVIRRDDFGPVVWHVGDYGHYKSIAEKTQWTAEELPNLDVSKLILQSVGGSRFVFVCCFARELWKSLCRQTHHNFIAPRGTRRAGTHCVTSVVAHESPWLRFDGICKSVGRRLVMWLDEEEDDQ